MSETTITAGKRTMQAYLRTPVADGPSPGVVVLHDALGQTDVSRYHVDWLAESGHLAIAPDLFSWASTPRCVVSAFRSLAQRKGPAFDAIDASLELLRSRSDCNGKVAVVGFCMGGGFALVAAAAGKVQASSVNYGMVPKDVDQLLTQSCPIIGSFGARDATLKGAAAKLTRSAEWTASLTTSRNTRKPAMPLWTLIPGLEVGL